MRRLLRTVQWLGILAVLAFLMINIHEVGHTIAARIAGGSAATYHLYQLFPDGSYCIGCNVYHPEKLSFVGKIWVSLAGVVATQLCALAVLGALWVARTKFYRRLLVAFLFVTVIGDGVWQAVQGLLADVTRQSGLTGVDFADMMYLFRADKGLLVTQQKAWLLLGIVVYLLVLGYVVFLSQKKRRHVE